MATCPRCGTNRKLLKRVDRWLYCKLHGRVRPIRSPDKPVINLEVNNVHHSS